MYIVSEKNDEPVFITAYIKYYPSVAHLVSVFKIRSNFMRALPFPFNNYFIPGF